MFQFLTYIVLRMKRSGSGNLDEIPADEPFTRGGVRSTAGPRLCGNSTTNPRLVQFYWF